MSDEEDVDAVIDLDELSQRNYESAIFYTSPEFVENAMAVALAMGPQLANFIFDSQSSLSDAYLPTNHAGSMSGLRNFCFCFLLCYLLFRFTLYFACLRIFDSLRVSFFLLFLILSEVIEHLYSTFFL